VDGSNVGTDTGYATLRFANNNGQLANGKYDTNTYIDKVVSRGGGRGIFCVSQSGGAVISNVDLSNNGNNALLIENCYNLAIKGGKVSGGGEVRLAARSEFPNNKDISVTLKVDNNSVRESPCGENTTFSVTGNAGHVGCLLVDERMKEGMGGDVWSWGAETYTNKTTSTLLYHGRRGDLRCTSVT
jgi:hypothetical protein